ncbi:uncharacterized protein LOC126188440 [Schistocerca cancellata]|uniref:uncharacterized protein LOC126188440 n=1 Tax=Schistocerca cancellata TaxID=274614 RepID=UPI0021173958|nr:uncharacterized protein LOC126188440 [Schistocerca cancellata]
MGTLRQVCRCAQRPVLTRLTADPAVALPFPAVTVCSLNRARCDSMAALWHEAVQAQTAEAANLLRLLQMARCPQVLGGHQHSYDNSEAFPLFCSSFTQQEEADSEENAFNRRMDFLAAYLSFSKEQRALMGDSFQQLVISCQFSGTSCLSESQYFARSVHSGYGNCYTFTTNRKTVLPGKEYGLSLQLSLSREQQLRATLSPEVGARLIIHSPQLAPMPDEAGLNVPPGVATSVALQQVEIIRKELPYTTNCSSTWERTWYASYVGETFKYSLERLQYLPTTSSVVPVSSSQKVSLGVTNAESDTVAENAAEVPKEAILTEVESTAASEEPHSVTAEVTPPALEPAPTAVTPSPSPAVAAQTTSPAIAEETPSATAEATPPAVEPVPIAAAPSPTPAVAEPTPLPVITETTPPPAATKPTSPTAETLPAPPPSPSRVAEKNRPVTRCRRICLQIAFEEKCQCTHPNYMDLDRGKPPCNLTSDSSDSHCAFTVLEEFEHRLRACSCNVDCREVTYQTSISTAIWPTDSTWCTVAKRFTLVGNCDNVTEGNHGAKLHPEKQIIKDNALKIDVYFENLRVQQTVQTAAYEPQAFVASLGGALSLYLGISLLMLVEVVELIIRVISDLYNHFRKQTQMHPKTKGHNLNSAFAHKGRSEVRTSQLRPAFVW